MDQNEALELVPKAKAKREWDKDFPDMYRAPHGIYYLRYWSPRLGREIEVSLKTDVKARAERERKRRIEAIDQEKDRDSAGYKRFSQIINEYLELDPWERVRTKLAAKNQLRNHILPALGGYPPERITNDLWRKVAKKKREEDPGCSLYNMRKYLGQVLRWAHKRGIIRRVPELDNFDKEATSPGVYVTQAQFDAIFEHLNDDWRDMALLCRYVGLRIGEVKGLSWDRVLEIEDDFGNQIIELHLLPEHTKTKKERRSPVPEHIRQLLLRRRQKTMGSRWVFPSTKSDLNHYSTSDTVWQNAKKETGIDIRIHDLRHTFLTDAFKATNRYAEICKYAGLDLDVAIKTYVKFTRKDLQIISSIFERLPGRTGENKNES